MRNCSTLLKTLLVALFVMAAQSYAPAAFAQAKLTSGTWTNGLGGTVTIANISPAGQITGTYMVDAGCNPGKPQPITGWYYDSGTGGGAITFTTSLQGCASTVSWSGQYDAKTATFYTLWHLAAASPPIWNGIVAGAHVFAPKK
jgi:hypothetical protein